MSSAEASLGDRAGACVLAVALGITAARAFRPVHDYALGHWMLTWAEGPIKRGLVGSLFAPLTAFKSQGEVRDLVGLLSVLLLVGVLIWTHGHLRSWAREGWHAWLSALAVATSGWVVLASHTSGFFDRWLELATLACLALVGTRGRWLVPLIAVLATATHEAFLAYGLPVLLVATLLKGRRPWLEAGLLAGSTGVCAAVVLAFSQSLGPAARGRLAERVSMLLGPENTAGVVFHLTPDAWEAARVQAHRPFVLAEGSVVLIPAVLLLWAWMMPALVRSRGWGFGAAAWAASVAPLSLTFVAWDAPRFAAMVVFQCLALWVVIRPSVPETTAVGRRWLGLLAAVAIGVQLALPVPLLGDNTDGDALAWPRATPTLSSVKRCQPAFSNASFERGLQGWEVAGQVDSARGWAPGKHGPRFAKTRKKAVGSLRSPRFRIDRPWLVGRVGGDTDAEGMSVTLHVDGELVGSSTRPGTEDFDSIAWDLSDLQGRWAEIEVKDASEQGMLRVDLFCFFTGVQPLLARGSGVDETRR